MARTFVIRWIVATVVVSLIAFFDHGWISHWLALSPERVWHGEVWRLVTWVLIVPSPISTAVSCYAIYKYGGALADCWGERRLRRFMIELIASAALMTCLLSLITGQTGAHVGGIVTTLSLVIAWARLFFNQPIRLWGVPMQGRHLVAIACGATILFAFVNGLYEMAPELVACAIAAGYPRGWLSTRDGSSRR